MQIKNWNQFNWYLEINIKMISLLNLILSSNMLL